MRIFLPNIVQENREGINAEKSCKRELSHYGGEGQQCCANDARPDVGQNNRQKCSPPAASQAVSCLRENSRVDRRSEEHTSELQSHSDLVCRLLLEKKK